MREVNYFNKREEFGNFEANLRFLIETNVLNRRANILEIGSGKGKLLNYFFQNGYNIKGIEIKESMIEESKKLYGHLPLYRMSGKALGFKDSSFDIVLSFDVFEHISDSDQHLQEVRRILKPGGHYLLQTPNKWTNFIFETIRWRSVSKWRKDHCSLHNYWEIKKRFKKNGFDIIFYDIPVVNDFFIFKIKTYLGKFGVFVLKIMNPDKLPYFLKTNFYIKAKKK